MFTEKFKANKSGEKLYIDYFQGSVFIDIESDKNAYEYLIRQASVLEQLRSNVLKEADKFVNE